MLRTHTYKTTAVIGTTSVMRDELNACQHHTEEYGSSISMDGDTAIYAMQDDSISTETRQILKELLECFADTEMFTFNP